MGSYRCIEPIFPAFFKCGGTFYQAGLSLVCAWATCGVMLRVNVQATNQGNEGTGTMKKLEDKIGLFFRGFPNLSKSSREALVGAWPWIALVFGALQALAAWALWNLVQTAETIVGTYGSFYIKYPDALSSLDKSVIYVGIGFLALDAVILLMAYPALKKRRRRGWELLFLAALVNAAYSLVGLFITSRGIMSFVMSLIGTGAGLYLLFQVRGAYGTVKASKKRH
jgi:hypothetical protein